MRCSTNNAFCAGRCSTKVGNYAAAAGVTLLAPLAGVTGANLPPSRSFLLTPLYGYPISRLMKSPSAKSVCATASKSPPAGSPRDPRPAALRSLVCLGALCALTLLVGCQNDQSQRDAYLRELRMQEDQIYEIQDYMTEYQELLRQQRCENEKLRERLAEFSASDSPASDRLKPLETDTEDSTDDETSLLDRPSAAGKPSAPDEPTEALDPMRNEDEESSELPEIDFGDPALPEIDLGEPLPAEKIEAIDPGGPAPEELPASDLGSLSQASVDLDDQDLNADVRAAIFAPLPQPVDPAESCVLYAEQMPVENNVTTGPGDNEGDNADHPTDVQIGLMAIVEPLTSTGAAGAFAGEVSLMLVDPIAGEEDWEIARWDYTAEEVELSWRDVSRRVLDLPLATPASTPVGRPLELWVRLVPQHGKTKLLCSTAITLVDPVRLVGVPVSGGASSTLPGAVSSGWNAADVLGPKAQATAKTEPSVWRKSVTLPPVALARAEAQPAKPSDSQQSETPSEGQTPVAAKPAEWSPFR